MCDILWGAKPVGCVSISMEGLYYRFSCSCNLPNVGTYKVYVTDGINRYDLGICVPDGEKYTCVARVACKRFLCAELNFFLVDCDVRRTIPVATGRQFAYLDRLNTARLQITNGQPEIFIELTPDQQGSDLSLTHPHK